MLEGFVGLFAELVRKALLRSPNLKSFQNVHEYLCSSSTWLYIFNPLVIAIKKSYCLLH